MTKRRFTRNQIQKILEEYEQGTSIQSIIEEYNISKATFYNWKAKYGRSYSNNPEEISKLIEDNERLKRMFAELSLENMKLKMQLNKINER
ncbi:MAG: transposase [Draconibacterium sp.]